jgi:aminoglycoside phosphotransferase (APT) family kinase protein
MSPIDENIELWRQCGEIVRRIHETTPVQSTGEERFGYPYPARRFTRWSEMVLDRFARIYESLVAQRLEVKAFRNISELARANASLLDEIDIPHLLHGDLWTFNLLVRRGKGGPAISGVLDVERAWWGDPMADWIMFLLAIRRDDPAWQGRRSWTARVSAFFEGYGIPTSDGAALFRQEVYKAMHIGLCAVWGAKKGDEGDVARARRELREIARALPSLF